ncbi:MAG: hypothetical protein R3A43_07345 [Bacteroidia bacterium]
MAPTACHQKRRQNSLHQPVPMGVYGYQLDIVSWSGEKFRYTGTVTLIR